MLHTLYVPAAPDPRTDGIARGSAIVGELQEDGSLLVDFEGNSIGSLSLRRFANRALKAAARQAERYPTRARLIIPADLMVAVGEFDSREQVVRLTGPESEATLAEWLDTGNVDASDLIARRD